MSALHTRIRTLRRQHQRTLKEIADRCGFTVSLLSKIESGKVSPPVATLTKIAEALGVTVSSLLDGGNQQTTLVTRARKLTADTRTQTDKGYGFHFLAVDRVDKVMQPILFVAEKGKIQPGAMSHSGQEFVYVLTGRMRYKVGDAAYDLGPGDSIYFDAAEDHDLEPLTSTVKYLAVFTDQGPGHRPSSTKQAKLL